MVKPIHIRQRFVYAGVIGILAVALALRLWDLTARPLWLDEAVEYWTATAPTAHLASTVRDVIQDPPLYSFLLHLWMSISSHETWVRLMSVCVGMAGVAGAMVIGHRLQGRATAMAAGLLMAVLPVAVRYSQEVGQYAMVHCLVLWNLAVLVGLSREPSRRGFVRWTVLAVVAAYSYYGTVITVLVPFACFMVESALQRDAVRLRRALWSLGAFVAAVLPLLVYFIPHQLRRGPTAEAFHAVAFQGAGEALRIAGRSLQATLAFQFTGWPCSRVPGWLTITVFAVIVLLVFKRQRRVTIWFAATFLVYLGLNLFHIFPLGFRHSNILTALLVPLAAGAVTARSEQRLSRVAGVVAFAVLCGLCVVSLPNRSLQERVLEHTTCAWPETEDIATVARYWMAHRAPGQPTYVYYGAAPAFAYYARQLGMEQTARPPDWFQRCWRGEGERWCAEGGVYYGEWIRDLAPEQKLESIFATMGGMPDEFWMILAHAKGGENITLARHLYQHYVFMDNFTATDASVVLVRRRAR